MNLEERCRGTLLGLAAGDALGTTLEFAFQSEADRVEDIVGGGPFQLQAGQWTDDTSMALCLADSIRNKGFDPVDQLERYVRWWREGYMSANGHCFDIGNTTVQALSNFVHTRRPDSGSTDENAAGNGSIMRLAPVPLAWAHDLGRAVELSGESSRTTHGAHACISACRVLGALIVGAVNGTAKEELLRPEGDVLQAASFGHELHPEVMEVVHGAYLTRRSTRRVSGYVVDTLSAALWAFERTDNFRDAAIEVVNLAGDADTSGAVLGQLAGAYYGEAGIPENWLMTLAHAPMIASLADDLYAYSISQSKHRGRRKRTI